MFWPKAPNPVSLMYKHFAGQRLHRGQECTICMANLWVRMRHVHDAHAVKTSAAQAPPRYERLLWRFHCTIEPWQRRALWSVFKQNHSGQKWTTSDWSSSQDYRENGKLRVDCKFQLQRFVSSPNFLSRQQQCELSHASFHLTIIAALAVQELDHENRRRRRRRRRRRPAWDVLGVKLVFCHRPPEHERWREDAAAAVDSSASASSATATTATATATAMSAGRRGERPGTRTYRPTRSWGRPVQPWSRVGLCKQALLGQLGKVTVELA